MSDRTDTARAAEFGCSREYVQIQCRKGRWPHYRVARTNFFTPEDVAAIKAIQRPAPATEPENEWGVKTRRAS
jgi:hypothetical protein